MHNVTEIQRRLQALGYLRPGEDDGKFGPISLDAYNHWRASKGAGPVSGASLSQLDQDLFPEDYKPLFPKGLNIVQATAIDYLLNFLTSKINWAAAALVAFGVTWINTRFGFNVPQDVQNWVTGLLITGGGALIMVLRTFFNKPKVVSGGVVTK